VDASYRTYNEWQKLTSEQRAAILAAREKEKNEGKDEVSTKDEKDGTNKNMEAQNKKRLERKRARRQSNTHESNRQGDEEGYNEDEDPL
jgi:hypothetical protein